MLAATIDSSKKKHGLEIQTRNVAYSFFLSYAIFIYTLILIHEIIAYIDDG